MLALLELVLVVLQLLLALLELVLASCCRDSNSVTAFGAQCPVCSNKGGGVQLGTPHGCAAQQGDRAVSCTRQRKAGSIRRMHCVPLVAAL